MNLLKIVFQISMLYVIYLLGEWIQDSLQLFVPGSIIGMLILFVLLMTRIMKEEWIESGAQFLIKHLPLLFLPVTVGIIAYFEFFAGKGFFIILIVLFSTSLVMIGTAKFAQQLLKKKKVTENE